MHEPFDEVLDELDEEPERGDAGDVALEFVADLVGHEPHLLPLQQLTLGIVGPPLHVRRVPRHFRQLLDRTPRAPRPPASLTRRAQRAMDDQIRIAADRRREVRVALRREAEMTEVLGRVARLLHRPQHEERDGLLLRLALDALEQPLEVPRPQAVGGAARL